MLKNDRKIETNKQDQVTNSCFKKTKQSKKETKPHRLDYSRFRMWQRTKNMEEISTGTGIAVRKIDKTVYMHCP